jgi:hypothetical protein
MDIKTRSMPLFIIMVYKASVNTSCFKILCVQGRVLGSGFLKKFVSILILTIELTKLGDLSCSILTGITDQDLILDWGNLRCKLVGFWSRKTEKK